MQNNLVAGTIFTIIDIMRIALPIIELDKRQMRHFVNFHQTGADEFVVLLREDDRYAVCKLQPRRLIAMSPNYQAAGYGLLSGPASPAGLVDILQWTNEPEAVDRYLALANLPANVVPLFPDRRPPG